MEPLSLLKHFPVNFQGIIKFGWASGGLMPPPVNSVRTSWYLLDHNNCVRRGSHLSLSQSPRKFIESTVNIIAMPGKTVTHHAWVTY